MRGKLAGSAIGNARLDRLERTPSGSRPAQSVRSSAWKPKGESQTSGLVGRNGAPSPKPPPSPRLPPSLKRRRDKTADRPRSQVRKQSRSGNPSHSVPGRRPIGSLEDSRFEPGEASMDAQVTSAGWQARTENSNGNRKVRIPDRSHAPKDPRPKPQVPGETQMGAQRGIQEAAGHRGEARQQLASRRRAQGSASEIQGRQEGEVGTLQADHP